MLAYAFQNHEDASGIVSRLAWSYPEHGFNPESKVYWFADDKGLHEIWVEPQF
ncbi:hypothetical protein [Methylobacterium sp. A54F]